MSRYLLDTTVLIEYADGHEGVCAKVLGLIRGKHDLGVSPVSIAEYYSKVAPGADPEIDRFLARLACWDATFLIGQLAGAYRFSVPTPESKRFAVPDMLIAATARYYQATLLTNNVRDFPFPDLQVEQLGGTDS